MTGPKPYRPPIMGSNSREDPALSDKGGWSVVIVMLEMPMTFPKPRPDCTVLKDEYFFKKSRFPTVPQPQ